MEAVQHPGVAALIIGIVGSEAKKFTPYTEEKARESIRVLLGRYSPVQRVVSGRCHLGGVDLFAIEEATKLGIETKEYPPKILRWAGGYRERNIEISETSDLVVCITVRVLPEHYRGMRWPLCYHCGTDTHVKSGGCWTMHYARRIGKETQLVVI